MTRIDSLVAKFNSEFVVYNSGVQALLSANEVVDFADTQTLYRCTNRKEQVCQMFALRDRGVISWDENIELQARTKGFAVNKVVDIAIPMRAALNAAKPAVVDNTAELEALRAQLAAKDAEISKVVSKLKYERESHANTSNELVRVNSKLRKAERKISIMMGIKVAQAAYMQVAHGVVQKVRG